jgi:hypothetical protein
MKLRYDGFFLWRNNATDEQRNSATAEQLNSATAE